MSVYQKLGGVVFCGVLLLAGRSSFGQLNKAHDECYKPMLDLSGKLNDYVNSAESRARYDDVKSLADNYQSRLEKMISYVDYIGREFKDSENRDWASSMKSTLMDKTKTAKDRAEALKRRAGDKQDCAAEVKGLAESLASLSDAYKTAVNSHNDRLKRVLDDYTKVQNAWYDASRDDRKALEDAQAKYLKAVERRRAAIDKQVRALEAVTRIVDEDAKAQKTMQDTKDKRVEDVEKARDADRTSRDLVKRGETVLADVEGDIKSAEADVLSAHADMMSALQTYEKEATQTDDTLTKEVLPRQYRQDEMKKEYDGKISL